MLKHNRRFSPNGFTLVELLVVIIILAILGAIALVLFNPIAQLNKVNDAQRRQDLEQIRSALDTYYNDHNYYPQIVPFGAEWDGSNGNVYMKHVPQDRNCTSGSSYCYVYQTDASSSYPQWNVLYAKLSKAPVNTQEWCASVLKTACNKPHLSVSLKYSQAFCLLSGNIDCDYINTTPLPTSGPLPSATPPPAPTLTPAPQVDCFPNSYYAVSPSSGLCNSVSSDKCNIYRGSLTCVSGSNPPRDFTHCSGLPCTH
jgi:prepilin-type N-terminal cleavage/methylation domain-containing protein